MVRRRNLLINKAITHTHTHTHTHTQDETVGALDLGGASAEISFEVYDSSTSSVYKSSEKLFDRTHNIFARSFLCYGENEAYTRFLAYLVNKVEKPVHVHTHVT